MKSLVAYLPDSSFVRRFSLKLFVSLLSYSEVVKRGVVFYSSEMVVT